MAQQPPDADDARRPLRGRAGESPDRIDLPFWVDACILLDPPLRKGKVRTARHAVYPVARALMADRINARGDEAVRLNRTALARWAGYDHAQNGAWILTYLERIGFLEIQQSWTAAGKNADTFDVFTTPPANYIGPTTYAELDMALRAQADGQGVRLFSQVNPSTAREGVGSDPSTARAEEAQVNPSTAREGVGSDPSTARAEEAQVNPSTAREGVASKEEIFDLSDRREIEDRSTERDAARFAGADAAAPEDDELTAAVRRLVDRLPWEDTAKGRNAAVLDAANTVLVPAIVKAVRAGWLTLEGAQDHALRKLEEADKNPVRYIANGFAADLIPLPAPDDVLTLPSAKAPKGAPVVDEQSGKGSAAEQGLPTGSPAAARPNRVELPAEYAPREFTADDLEAARRKRAEIFAQLGRTNRPAAGGDHS